MDRKAFVDFWDLISSITRINQLVLFTGPVTVPSATPFHIYQILCRFLTIFYHTGMDSSSQGTCQSTGHSRCEEEAPMPRVFCDSSPIS